MLGAVGSGDVLPAAGYMIVFRSHAERAETSVTVCLSCGRVHDAPQQQIQLVTAVLPLAEQCEQPGMHSGALGAQHSTGMLALPKPAKVRSPSSARTTSTSRVGCGSLSTAFTSTPRSAAPLICRRLHPTATSE